MPHSQSSHLLASAYLTKHLIKQNSLSAFSSLCYTELPTVLFYGTFSTWGFRPMALGSCHQCDVPIMSRPKARSASAASVGSSKVREERTPEGKAAGALPGARFMEGFCPLRAWQKMLCMSLRLGFKESRSSSFILWLFSWIAVMPEETKTIGCQSWRVQPWRQVPGWRGHIAKGGHGLRGGCQGSLSPCFSPKCPSDPLHPSPFFSALSFYTLLTYRMT